MADTVRWNGHKDRKVVLNFDDINMSSAEKGFFASLRKLDAEMDGRDRTATEDEFLNTMRDFLDELERTDPRNQKK